MVEAYVDHLSNYRGTHLVADKFVANTLLDQEMIREHIGYLLNSNPDIGLFNAMAKINAIFEIDRAITRT